MNPDATADAPPPAAPGGGPGPAERWLGRRFVTPSTTGSSFERERLDLLWRRSRLVLLLGVAIVVVILTVAKLLLRPPLAAMTDAERLEWWLDFGHPAILIVGLALLYLGRPGTRRIQAVMFGVFAAGLALHFAIFALFRPAYELDFAVALMLFLAAALIPWRLTWQLWLGAFALAAFLLTEGIAYRSAESVRAYWAGRGGGEAFRLYLIGHVTTIAILSATSALVTGTLYSLRRAAHEAKRLGNYLIRRELGEGGMGKVYEAEHALLCRPTALKVLTARGDGEALARFEREVRLSSSLTHPNTITIFDFGRGEDDTFFYAMEYLEGLDLEEMVRKFGPLSGARVAHLLLQVCGSLSEAHGLGIVHRDLKPSNIFVTRRGGVHDFVKVLDFGLAKRMPTDGAPGLTRTGMVFGTPRYLAPETVYGAEAADARADLYSLGGTAYWMLTGHPPFEADSAVALMIDHVKSAPRRPSEIAELPIEPGLEAIVMRCLEKKPEDRFRSAEEMAAALRGLSFAEPWTPERAREWWELHLGEPAGAPAL